MVLRYISSISAVGAAMVLATELCWAGPAVFWASDPVRPGETVLVYGVEFVTPAKVQLRRHADGDRSGLPGTEERDVQISQMSSTSLMFEIPANLPDGIFHYRLVMKGEAFDGYVNRPVVYWTQGDLGRQATKGGWIRVIGLNIARTSVSTLRLVKQGTKSEGITLVSDVAGAWDASFKMPHEIEPGSYEGQLSNGYGGPQDAATIKISIVSPPVRPTSHISVKEFGAKGNGKSDDTEAFREGLRSLSLAGGILRVPRGAYLISGTLNVPAHVAIRGDEQGQSILILNDEIDPPSPMISGVRDFSIENLTILASRHGHVIVGGVDADNQVVSEANISLDHVIVRADMFRRHINPKESAEIHALSLSRFPPRGPDLIRLAGGNIRIENTDIYGSGNSLYVHNAFMALIRGNRFYNGRGGWYSITNPDGLIFENNDIIGGDNQAGGGGVNTLWGPGRAVAQNVLVKGNRFSMLHGGDGEGLTSDGPGGCYYGGVIAKSGERIVRLTDTERQQLAIDRCRGGGLVVLSGKGAGQHAVISGIRAPSVELEVPLPVSTDESSVVVIVPVHRRYLIVDNHATDTGVAFQFYGSAWEQVVANNKTERTGGLVVHGKLYKTHYQPAYFTQFLDNTIIGGNITGLARFRYSPAVIRAISSPTPPHKTLLVAGVVVRGNKLSGGAYIDIQGKDAVVPSVAGILIEHNSVRDSEYGIVTDKGTSDVMIRGNQFIGVSQEIRDLSRRQ